MDIKQQGYMVVTEIDSGFAKSTNVHKSTLVNLHGFNLYLNTNFVLTFYTSYFEILPNGLILNTCIIRYDHLAFIYICSFFLINYIS